MMSCAHEKWITVNFSDMGMLLDMIKACVEMDGCQFQDI